MKSNSPAPEARAVNERRFRITAKGNKATKKELLPLVLYGSGSFAIKKSHIHYS